MKIRLTTLTITAAFAVALPLHAQSMNALHASGQGMMMCGAMEHGATHGAAAQQHGQMQHGAANMHEMMGGYAGNPAMILHHATELELTAAQVERIRSLQQAGETDCNAHMKLAHEQHTAATAALQAQTPNLATFEAKLKEAAQHMVQAHVAMARRGVEALNVLTAGQRTRLLANKHDMPPATQHKH